MSEDLHSNALEELRNTAESANALLRSNILLVSAILAGLSILYNSDSLSISSFAKSTWFSLGIGSLFSSIALSIQTQILRWSENSNIIPVNLYQESEKAANFSTEILQRKVRQTQGILYIGYLFFFAGLTSLGLSLLANFQVRNLSLIGFGLPLVLSLVVMKYYLNKKRWSNSY